jgi:predicted phosphodiesterase
MMYRDMEEFDQLRADELKAIWFLGDVHGHFSHIFEAFEQALEKPRWLVFLGDIIDLNFMDPAKSFREVFVEPIKLLYPQIKVAFIYGNHDADDYQAWDLLHDCGDAVPLHGRVVDLGGILVAGIGGNIMGRVWSPPCKATFENKHEAMNQASQSQNGQKPNPSLNAAIYPDDVKKLSKFRADILVTHEAFTPHPYGWDVLSQLARDMRVVRAFHGHQHDDRSAEYASVRDEIRFDGRGVGFCCITNGLGQIIGKPGYNRDFSEDEFDPNW